jgi:hypothetical protein
MGAPVEIEFAVDLSRKRNNQPTLYLLQIKPLIRLETHADISFEDVEEEKVIVQSLKGMGNGRVETIRDVIFMNVDKFDRTKTTEMAREIAEMNKYFDSGNTEYVLIGPGRWGTRDRFTGIPVLWSQISHARVIVEMGLPDFPLEASLGSHFFHNVTSMNVGYFSVHHEKKDEWVNFERLQRQEVISRSEYFTHVRFSQPLTILMDGKQQKAVVMCNEKPKEEEPEILF